MPAILFICTANRFRSPLAVAMFSQLLTKADLMDQWSVSSAGTWTEEGLPATREALELAKIMGSDLSTHRSRIVSEALVSSADLVIVMEQGHKEALINEFMGIEQRVHTLAGLAGKPVYDIPDPYRNNDESPTAVASELHQLLEKAFDRIVDCLETDQKKETT